MGVTEAADMRVVLGEDDTAVLVTLAVILKVTYLLLTFKSEADPGEVYYFLSPRVLDPSYWKR